MLTAPSPDSSKMATAAVTISSASSSSSVRPGPGLGTSTCLPITARSAMAWSAPGRAAHGISPVTVWRSRPSATSSARCRHGVEPGAGVAASEHADHRGVRDDELWAGIIGHEPLAKPTASSRPPRAIAVAAPSATGRRPGRTRGRRRDPPWRRAARRRAVRTSGGRGRRRRRANDRTRPSSPPASRPEPPVLGRAARPRCRSRLRPEHRASRRRPRPRSTSPIHPVMCGSEAHGFGIGEAGRAAKAGAGVDEAPSANDPIPRQNIVTAMTRCRPRGPPRRRPRTTPVASCPG